MNYLEIITRIEQELAELKEIEIHIKTFLNELENSPSEITKDALINAIALNLHSFYTGVERIFEIIARRLDYLELSGSDWHRQLLEQMSLDVPNVRQAVISSSLRAELDELRRFRHVVRSIYAYKLEAKPVLELSRKLSIISQNLEQETQNFLSGIKEE